MRNFILVLVGGLAMSACKQQIVKEIVEVPVLSASAITNADSIYNYHVQYPGTHKEIADSYFNKGLSEADDNLLKAIYYIKRSITLNPTTQAYKELGIMLERAGKYDEATNVYELLSFPSYRYFNGQSQGIFIFDEPDLDTYNNFLVNYYLANNNINFRPFYGSAEESIDKSALKEKFVSDQRIQLDTSSIAFKNLRYMAMSNEEMEEYQKTEANFYDLISSIKSDAQSFVISKEMVSTFHYSNDGEWDESESIPMSYDMYLEEKQAKPDSWFSYNFNYATKINDTIHAVIYAIDSSEIACPKEMRHIYHRLVTYGKKGNIIDSKIVAYQSGEDLATMTYSDRTINIRREKRIWKKPYVKKDFDNDLVKTELLREERFLIDDEGEITPLNDETLSVNQEGLN